MESTNDKALPSNILRNLSDRTYDKRKSAALEVQKIVENYVHNNKKNRIPEVLKLLANEFTSSPNDNSRKGGLIALAAASVGLTGIIDEYLHLLLPPILHCFEDNQSRVRYYACESLYNVAKIARQHILTHFNVVFEGVCKLFGDVDVDVKNGANLLDRLIKDIVTESDLFDIAKFIPILQRYITRNNPYIRQLLLTWITVLDSVPGIEMLNWLHNLLEGLFSMLADANKEISQAAKSVLDEFLKKIENLPNYHIEQDHDLLLNRTSESMANLEVDGSRTTSGSNTNINNQQQEQVPPIPPSSSSKKMSSITSATSSMVPYTDEIILNFDSMVPVLVLQSNAKEKSNRKNALIWIKTLVTLVREDLAPHYALIFGAIIHCISDPEEEIRVYASGANLELLELVKSTNSTHFEIDNLIKKILHNLLVKIEATLLASLNWISMLLEKFPSKLDPHTDDILQSLLRTLSNETDEVVLLDLKVIARLSIQPEKFERILEYLLTFFQKDRQLLERRGSLAIRQLSVLIDPVSLYMSFARILAKNPDLAFVSMMVQTLNLILLTAGEVEPLRLALRKALYKPVTTTINKEKEKELKNEIENEQEKREDEVISLNDNISNNESVVVEEGNFELFAALFHCWCHNPVSTLSLCFLAEGYQLTQRLVATFSTIEMSIGFLMQIDKLIQLLESPIFISLRMQLLEGYGVLSRLQGGNEELLLGFDEETMNISLQHAQHHDALIQSLYGLLMILPQSTAYRTLADRLATIAGMPKSMVTSVISKTANKAKISSNKTAPLYNSSKSSSATSPSPFKKRIPTITEEQISTLINSFLEIQNKHEEAKLVELKRKKINSKVSTKLSNPYMSSSN